MCRKKKQPNWRRFMLGGIVLILGTGFLYAGVIRAMKRQEADRSVVTIQSDEKRTLVFYKDDCSDCQNVFQALYWHNLFHQDLLFINLNQPENKHYIATYDLETVPTFVSKNNRYAGTEIKKIHQLLND